MEDQDLINELNKLEYDSVYTTEANTNERIDKIFKELGNEKKSICSMGSFVVKLNDTGVSGKDLDNYLGTIFNKLYGDEGAEKMGYFVQFLKQIGVSGEALSKCLGSIFEKLKGEENPEYNGLPWRQFGQNAKNMAVLVKALADAGVSGTALQNHLDKIFYKISGEQNADDMASLVKAPADAGVSGKALQNHLDKIFGKLSDKQNADDMASLVEALAKAKVKLMSDRVDTILEKLKGEQNAGNMASLVEALAKAGVSGKALQDHLDKIFGKFSDQQQSASSMQFLLEALAKAGVNVSNYVSLNTIFGKLDNEQNAQNMASLVEALAKAGVSEKTLQDHLDKIFGKLSDKQQSASSMQFLLETLAKAKVKLMSDRVDTILEKLKGEQNAKNMASLVKALANAGVNVSNYVSLNTIFGKLDNEQNAENMTVLVKALADAGVSGTALQDCFAKIFGKLDNEQNAENMTVLVKALADAGVKLTPGSGEVVVVRKEVVVVRKSVNVINNVINYVSLSTIFGKLDNKQNAEGMASLVAALSAAGVNGDDLSEHFDEIWKKLGNEQIADNMARLVKAVIEAGVNKYEYINKMVKKLSECGGDPSKLKAEKMELATIFKKKNPNSKLSPELADFADQEKKNVPLQGTFETVRNSETKDFSI